jgi:hypothetical protein
MDTHTELLQIIPLAAISRGEATVWTNTHLLHMTALAAPSLKGDDDDVGYKCADCHCANSKNHTQPIFYR